MMFRCSWLPLVLALAAPAQDVVLVRMDGRALEGRVTAVGEEDGRRHLRLRTGAGEESLPLTDVLAVHGAPPRQPTGDAVILVGGDVYRGELTAGDAIGETLGLDHPVLGTLRLAIDRVDQVVLGAGAVPRRLRLPEGAEGDEVLFLRAGRGLDTVVGTVHRFGRRHLEFARGRDEPRRYDYPDLVGLAVGGGYPPEEPARMVLLTRNGDRISGELKAWGEEHCEVILEGRSRRLPIEEVTCVTFLGPDRIFLSDLQPLQVREEAHGEPALGPLYPHRMDRACDGSPLVAGGRGHAKGIGVHSRSAITWRVPEAATGLLLRVGLDDGVRSLRPRPDVDVRVLLDDQVVFEVEGMQGGDPPRNPGVLPVTEGARLVLEVDFGKGLDLADRVDWLSAVFLLEPGK